MYFCIKILSFSINNFHFARHICARDEHWTRWERLCWKNSGGRVDKNSEVLLLRADLCFQISGHSDDSLAVKLIDHFFVMIHESWVSSLVMIIVHNNKLRKNKCWVRVQFIASIALVLALETKFFSTFFFFKHFILVS